MIAITGVHPSADELLAFGQGRLAPETAVVVEQHVAECDSCCRLLEDAAADSFMGRLRHAQVALPGTTADALAGTLTDATAVPPELADHPRYRVLQLLGQGGMGAVYKAEHRRMDRPVALKVIHPGLIRNPATVQRFQQEVRAAAKLQHANIVTAFDADQAGALHFLVMEHVEGRSLADLVNERGPLPIAEACDCIRQAALGLQHAHEQGMVHRDVKPHNLMRTASGQIKILDFGLARLARSPDPETTGNAPSTSLTGAGAVMGTADYIAPEQAHDPRTADIRSDIYALGCTLFHLLTGRPPYPDGGVQDKLARHAGTPLPSLKDALPDAPSELAAVLAHMTAKPPADRYATPAEVAEALAPFTLPSPPVLRGRGVGGEGAGTPKRRRRLLVAALVLVAAGIVAAGIIVLRIQTDRGEIVILVDDSSLEIVTKKGGEIVRIRDPKAGQTWELDTKNYHIRDLEKPDGLALELPWGGTVTLKSSGGKVVVMTGSPDVPFDADPAFKPLFNGRDLEGWDTSSLKVKDHWNVVDGILIGSAKEDQTVLIGRTKWIDFHLRARVRIKGQGKSGINFRGNAYQVEIGEKRTGSIALMSGPKWLSVKEHSLVQPETWFKLEVIADGPNITSRVNGQVVAAVNDSTHEKGSFGFLRLDLDARDGPVVVEFRSIEIKDLTPTNPVRTTDPAELAKLPNPADALKRADIPRDALAYLGGGDPENVPPELVGVLGDTRFRCSDRPGPMAFSADGKQLAVADAGDEVRLLDAQTGRLLRRIAPGKYTPQRRMAFSPDGRRLAGTRDAGELGEFSVIDAETGRLVWELKKFKLVQVVDFAFSFDGKLIHLSGRGSPHLETRDAETGALKASWDTGNRSGVNAFAYSPDGRLLVACKSEESRVHNMTTSTDQLLAAGNGVKAAFSPDGQHFAVASWAPGVKDRVVTLFSPTGVSLRHLSDPGDEILAFSPDGKTLVAVGKGDGNILVNRWKVPDGIKLSRFAVSGTKDQAIALSPDGKTLAVQWKFKIELYDTETGFPRHQNSGPVSSISALAFSADGKYLASSDLYYGTKLWDLATCREVTMWRDRQATRLAFSPDGKLVAAAGIKAVFVHQVPDGKLLHTLDARGNPVESLAFSPDGTHLATTGGGDDVRVWRVADGKQLRILGYPEGARAVTFSPDGSKLVAAGRHGIRVWDSLTGLESKDFLWECDCRLIDWLPDGKTLAVDGRGTTGHGIRHVDPDTGKFVRPHPGYPNYSVYAASPGARFVCAGSYGVGFILMDLRFALTDDLQRQRVFRLGPPRGPATGVQAAAFSPDGRYLACGNAEGVISLLRLSEQGKVPELQVRAPTARELAERPNPADALKPEDVPESARAHVAGGDAKKAPRELVAVLGDMAFRATDIPGPLAYSPDGKLLAAADVASRGRVWNFDARTGRLLRQLATGCDLRYRIAFSPDGKRLAGCGFEDTFSVIDAETGRLVWKLEDTKLPGVDRFAFSEDGKRIMLSTKLSPGLVEHAAQTGTWMNTEQTGADPVRDFAYCADGTKLVYIKSGDSAAYFYNRASEYKLGRHAIRVAAAPGGKHFAIAWAKDPKDPTSDYRVTVQSTNSNEEHTLPVRGDNLLAFTADGKTLLAIEPIKAITVSYSSWDVETGERLSQQTLPVPPGKHDYAFNPDGKDVAILEHGEGQCVVRLYDTATGKPRLPEVGHRAALTAIAWSPDGQKLATADATGSVLVWDPSRIAPVAVYNGIPGKKVDCLLFAPDSQRILALGMKDGVHWMAYYPAGRGEPQMFDKVRLPSKCAAFSPDGQWLAVGTNDGTVSIWDAREAQEVRVLLTQNPVRAVAFSPDGSELSAGEIAGLHIRWSTKYWKEIRRSSSVNEEIFHLEYLLGGTSIGIGTVNKGRFQGAFEWHTYSAVEHEIHQERSEPRGFDHLPRPLAIAPQMRLFAHSVPDGDILLWQSSAGKDRLRRFWYPKPGVAAFSPDGRYLAVGDHTGIVSILRLAERGRVPELPFIAEP
jgi:WD40 repeat protein/tRNA A-37 threonylcarbamoyl transferase component Bud32